MAKQELSIIEFKHTDFNEYYDCLYKYKRDQDRYMSLYYEDPSSEAFKALLKNWMTLHQKTVTIDNVINAPEKLYLGDVLKIQDGDKIIDYPITGLAVQDGSYVKLN